MGITGTEAQVEARRRRGLALLAKGFSCNAVAARAAIGTNSAAPAERREAALDRQGARPLSADGTTRSLRAGLRRRLLDLGSDCAIALGSLWRALSSQWGMAAVAPSGLEQPEAPTPSPAARRGGHRALEAVRLASYKKSVVTGKPLWALRMKAASRWSRRSNARGLRVARHRSYGPVLPILTALTSLGQCSLRRGVNACGCTSDFMPTTLPATISLAFWRRCSVADAGHWSWCGTISRRIGAKGCSSFWLAILVFMSFPCPPMRQHSIRSNIFGRRRPHIQQARLLAVPMNCAATFWLDSAVCVVPRRGSGPVSLRQRCRGIARKVDAHDLVKPQ